MARYAIISLTRATLEVPITTHSPMCAMIVIASLLAMTLATQLLRVGQRYAFPCGIVQKTRLLLTMTTGAFQVSMPQLNLAVEARKNSGALGQRLTLAASEMASPAGNGGGSPRLLRYERIQPSNTGWLRYGHRILMQSRLGSSLAANYGRNGFVLLATYSCEEHHSHEPSSSGPHDSSHRSES